MHRFLLACCLGSGGGRGRCTHPPQTASLPMLISVPGVNHENLIRQMIWACLWWPTSNHIRLKQGGMYYILGGLWLSLLRLSSDSFTLIVKHCWSCPPCHGPPPPPTRWSQVKIGGGAGLLSNKAFQQKLSSGEFINWSKRFYYAKFERWHLIGISKLLCNMNREYQWCILGGVNCVILMS